MTHRERQVERQFVTGLLWPHISPLQMNINKWLLISAACTVCVNMCVCEVGTEAQCEQAFLLLLLLLLLLLFHTTCISITFCSSFLLLMLTLTSLFFVSSLFFSSSFLSVYLTGLTPAFILPVYHSSLCFREGCRCHCWHWFCDKSKLSDFIFSCVLAI